MFEDNFFTTPAIESKINILSARSPRRICIINFYSRQTIAVKLSDPDPPVLLILKSFLPKHLFLLKHQKFSDYHIEAKLISATLLRVGQFAEQVSFANVNFAMYSVKIKANSMS